MNHTGRKIMVALGGNALESPDTPPTAANQRRFAMEAAGHIAQLIAQGNQVVVTHGNGPQVGRILLQSEAGREITPVLPLDLCGAMTQGAIGYHLQQTLGEQLAARGLYPPVVSLVTQVEVEESDPAFLDPSKPVGPFYTADEVVKFARAGTIYKEDAGRGWRKNVPSPRPYKILELEAVRTLMDSGALVIAGGGGGVPVAKTDTGYRGVEAVIDKDATASLLARQLEMDDLFILTAVPQVALCFGTPQQKNLSQLTVAQAEDYAKAGHFAPGSMLPKIQGAVEFVRQRPGARALITSLDQAVSAFNGKAGTAIVWQS